jgi:hypothetical protein
MSTVNGQEEASISQLEVSAGSNTEIETQPHPWNGFESHISF